MDYIEFIVVTIVIAVSVLGVNLYQAKRRAKEEADLKGSPRADEPAQPRGRENDRAVTLRAVKSFAARNGFEVIEPGRICQGTGVTDLDVILVGSFGVLGVKSLGYYGRIYGGEKEQLWSQTSKVGRAVFPNPLNTANAEARMLREVLFAANIKSVQVETVCVFPNKASELVMPRSTPVYRAREFAALLGKDKYTDDKHVDIDAVARALRNAAEK